MNIGTRSGPRHGPHRPAADHQRLLRAARSGSTWRRSPPGKRSATTRWTSDKPTEAARSAFLHRLIFLGVEIGTVQRETSPFGQSIFKEHWRLKWSPKIEASLIERSLHGDTVETAATTLLRESLGANAAEAGPACRRLVQAVDMDLPQLVAQAEQATGHAIDHDDRFHSLADALTSLMLLERYAAYPQSGPATAGGPDLAMFRPRLLCRARGGLGAAGGVGERGRTACWPSPSRWCSGRIWMRNCLRPTSTARQRYRRCRSSAARSWAC